jgi:hypothetical protein
MGNINERNSLNNNYNIDATIKSFNYNNNSKYYEIYCDESMNSMILKRTHPNFVQLYNKLIIGTTHNFKCSNWIFTYNEIINITECQNYIISDIIMGFLEIQNEIPILTHYEELITKNNITKRLLINKNIKQNILIGEKYEICYIKKIGDDFYNVTNFKLIERK